MEWRFEQHDTDATWPTPYKGDLLLGVGTAVCCVEQNNGHLRWESNVGANISSRPSVGQGMGFVVDNSGQLHAFEVSTGDSCWNHELNGNDAVPTVTDRESVIVTTREGVASIDIDTGEYNWEQELPRGPSGPPAVTEDSVYTGTEDGIVYALSKTDGTVQWETAIDRPLTRAGVVIENETLYVPTAPLRSDTPGAVYALDTTAHEVCWSVPTTTATSGFPYYVTSPLVYDGRVYVVSGSEIRGENHLQAIQNGQKVWCSDVDGVVSSSPAITNETVLIYSGGALVAFEPVSGEQQWNAWIGPTAHYNETIFDGAPIITDQSIVVRGPRNLFAVSIQADRQTASVDGSANADDQSLLNPASAVPVTKWAEDEIVRTSRVSYPSTTSRIRGPATARWGFYSARGALINPMLIDETVYLASTSGIATALDTETGTVRWVTDLDGKLEKCPLVSDETLFLVGRDRTFALDPRNGSLRSRDAALPEDPTPPTGHVATRADDIVSVGFTPDLEHITITVSTDEGIDDWKFKDEFPGRPTVWDSYYGQIGSTLFVGLMFKPGTAVFYTLDDNMESVQWRLVGNPGGGADVFSPPIRSDGRLFVTCSNRFYAIDLSHWS